MLTYEINQNDLIYYFKGNIARKRFYGFNNGRELFKKIKSCEMRLEEAKKKKTQQNVFTVFSLTSAPGAY